MTNDAPAASIKAQPQTNSPLAGFASALVDDPTYLVDDPNILVGSQTTIVESVKVKVTVLVPRPTIKIAR